MILPSIRHSTYTETSKLNSRSNLTARFTSLDVKKQLQNKLQDRQMQQQQQQQQQKQKKLNSNTVVVGVPSVASTSFTVNKQLITKTVLPKRLGKPEAYTRRMMTQHSEVSTIL